MKQIYSFTFSILTLFSLAGCVETPVPALVNFSKHSAYDYSTNEYSPLKTGKSSCFDYLQVIAFGDCTVSKAMEEGNITKVHSVEHGTADFNYIFSGFIIYREYSTIVKGE